MYNPPPPSYDEVLKKKQGKNVAMATVIVVDKQKQQPRQHQLRTNSKCPCGNNAKKACAWNSCKTCCLTHSDGGCRAHNRPCATCSDFSTAHQKCTCVPWHESIAASTEEDPTVADAQSLPASSEDSVEPRAVLLPFLRASPPGWDDEGSFHTALAFFGLPLFGFGLKPCAIFALGAFPRGMVCVGWLSFGYWFAIGQLSIGFGISGGQLAGGLMAAGQLAFGPICALGMVAIGLFVGGMVPLGPFDLFWFLEHGEIRTNPFFSGDD